MTDEYQIKVGDTVAVNFNNAQMTLISKAVVCSRPQATGDSWVFRDEKTGFIHYVSEGCTISKLIKEDAPSDCSAYSTVEMTKPGWYWFLIEGEEMVLEMRIMSVPAVFLRQKNSWKWVVDLALGGAKWSGPIISPNDKLSHRIQQTDK